MFTIDKYQQDGFAQVLLTDHNTRTSVAIVPDCGAMLHAFRVWDGDEVLNIIDSYNSKSEFDELAEANGFKGLKLSPFPCRIPGGLYRFNNHDFQLTNTLRNGAAIHGLLYRQSFQIIQEQVSGNSAILTLLHEYRNTDKGYPFAYSCLVEYRLEANNTLQISTQITNNSTTAMPLADGWHPYFTLGKRVDGLELQFQAREILEFVDLIPTGKTYPYSLFSSPKQIGEIALDNSYLLDFAQSQPLCVLRNPASGWQLSIQPENSYPYLQIYIPPHRNSIAIENLSAPPDSFNNGIGLVVLQPGAATRFVTQYTVERK
ncbi:MAG TPA: aldose 1-epimerase [Agriterribacter sp.]|nr:aldose 1-epimerase [Chitinophagaceae bacterium]HRP31633.1 aldose 1-epimerase [Agriterribacter sp.]